MSTQHRSAPLQAQKGAMRHTEERLCTEKTVPFWVVGFQKRFLERIQGFFQTSQNFQDAAPEVECLHFDVANPQKSSLVVERTYSKEGAGARSSSVHVHFNDLRFEKMGTADRAGNSADKATVFRVKAGKSSVTCHATHQDPDAALALMDLLSVYVDGTKFHWMQDFGLQALEVENLSGITRIAENPEALYRVTLTISYQLRLYIADTTESLPLKRVTFTPVAS